MKVKVIGCAIFEWMVEAYKEHYDCVFLEIAQHDRPEVLHDILQEEIHKSQDYDRIVLLYGLCGNAIMNLTSENAELFVFRAHDCSAILLGSNTKQLNQKWSCFPLQKEHKCWGFKSLQDLEEEYGEHAQYLWDMLYKNNDIAYITFHKEEDEKAIQYLVKDGKHIIAYFEGTTEVVEAILDGRDHEMVVKLKKGQRIKAVYGDEVIRPI